MINVLFVADKLTLGGATIHGVTRLFSWWIPLFNKSRYNVSLCCLRTRDVAGDFLEKKDINVIYLGRGKFNPLTLIDLIKIIKASEINILHLHGYSSTNFGRIASLVTGIPCIVHEHLFDKGIPFYQKWADCFLGRITPYAIAVSGLVKDFLVNSRSVSAEKIKVIYNGIPLETFSDISSERNWKLKLNIPESHKVVAIIGRLHPIKGHCYFLEAAQQILRKYKDVTFLVVGDGDLLSTLQEQSRYLCITANVVFMGYCDDIPSLLHEVDINVISSLLEGGPLTLFEAMAAGCVTVSTDTIGLKDTIKEGENGFLVSPKDTEAITEKVLLLLNDDCLLSNMRKMARELSRQYDISDTVRQFEEYYKTILRI